jgi:hypothetical protein
MMTAPLFSASALQEAFAALRKDLIHEDGPQISTMRNYRFAILPYRPEDEFKLRGEVQKLSGELVAAGWVVLSINLQRLLLDRVRAMPDGIAERIMQMEARMAGIGPERGLNYLKEKLDKLIEGPDGIAADCVRIIAEHAQANPETLERTLVLVGRAGALYPFFRLSALLRHLDGKTQHIPVVLLYPGHKVGNTGLSFMSESEADSDYRPRIYP